MVRAQGLSDLDAYVRLADRVPGWTRGEEAAELARRAAALPAEAEVVEIGSFFGASAILLGGARKLAGSGRVHCVDPFDLSGDGYSVRFYRDILTVEGGGRLRDHFDANIRAAGLSPWVQVHQGRATQVAVGWRTPIDLLYLDGDQSPVGARAAYDAWLPFLKPGGVIAVRNSNPADRAVDHGGSVLIVLSPAFAEAFTDIQLIGSTTYAVARAERPTRGRPNRLRVSFIQTSDADNYYDMLAQSARTVRQYCRRHGYGYESYVGVKRGHHPWHASFNQLYILAEILQRGQQDWVVCLDADAYVVDLDFDLTAYLSDKGDVAAVLTPACDDTPWWNINSGVLMINLRHPLGRKLVEQWLASFEAIYSDRVLENAVLEFVQPNDQDLLTAILRAHAEEMRPHIHLDDRRVLNSPHARFVRQMLRVFGPDVKARTDSIRTAADALLSADNAAAEALLAEKRRQVEAFLDAAYQLVLGRPIDAGGRATYTTMVDMLGLELGALHVVRSLMQSGEFRRRLAPAEHGTAV